MSVSVYFGLTESGKSYHLENHVIPSWDKVVVFDNAHCFSSQNVLNEPTDKMFLNCFHKFKNSKNYKIIVRSGRGGTTEGLFNKTVQLAIALGRAFSRDRVESKDRVQMITDEADFVCSSHYQSNELKHLVNKGRHDNVDSHFISRVPMQIHPDIRRNTSKIVTFRLQNASEIKLFTDNFGKILTNKIKELPKYCRLEWSDNGEVFIFDEKNQKNWKIIEKKKGFLK